MKKIIAIFVCSLLLVPIAQAREWKAVAVHITDTRLDYTLAMCNNGHRAIGWDSCGYNYLILRDGVLVEARGINKIGAHVKGHNRELLGIGFVGKDSITEEQAKTFWNFMRDRDMPIYPHNKFNQHKACPTQQVWNQLIEEK